MAKVGQAAVGEGSPGAAAPAAEAEPFDLLSLAEYDRATRVAALPNELADAREVAEALLEYLRTTSDPLPAFPIMAARGLQLLSNPDLEIGELVKLINSDPAMTAQVLRVANSAYYSRGIEVAAVGQAVSRLGLAKVAQLMAVTSLRTLYDPQIQAGQKRFSTVWRRLWSHSVVSAYGSLWLAVNVLDDPSGRAFVGGLLHDIGKIVALQGLGGLSYLGKFTERASPNQVEDVLEVLHVDVGVEMALRWQLPAFVADLIVDHHGLELPALPENYAAHVVRLVSGMNEVRTNPRFRWDLEEELDASARALTMDGVALHKVAATLREAAERAQALFSAA
ncbi:MAG: HDOD domain-containing protein [Deltaproteobacteria bacterium]|nr:HDOD domain-containing protein [Deltaproteobacteria bacterium]